MFWIACKKVLKKIWIIVKNWNCKKCGKIKLLVWKNWKINKFYNVKYFNGFFKYFILQCFKFG